MLAYLKVHCNTQIVFDTLYPEIYEEDFKIHDWGDLYRNDLEPVSLNEPMPLGSEFIMRAYVKVSFAE